MRWNLAVRGIKRFRRWVEARGYAGGSSRAATGPRHDRGRHPIQGCSALRQDAIRSLASRVRLIYTPSRGRGRMPTRVGQAERYRSFGPPSRAFATLSAASEGWRMCLRVGFV